MTRHLRSHRAYLTLAALALIGCTGTTCMRNLPPAEDILPVLEPIEVYETGFCQDWGPGLLFHDGETCFRELNCWYDCPQVCIDEDGNTTDSRDTISPVIGLAPNGNCVYDVPWDPISGTDAHQWFWTHAIIDVLGGSLSGF